MPDDTDVIRYLAEGLGSSPEAMRLAVEAVDAGCQTFEQRLAYMALARLRSAPTDLVLAALGERAVEPREWGTETALFITDPKEQAE